MAEAFVVAVKLGCLVCGICLLCYVGAYEREQKTAQTWLENAWLRLDDMDKAASTRLNTFLTALATGTNRILDRLYGAPLISIRAVFTPLCLSAPIFAVGCLFEMSVMQFETRVGLIAVAATGWIAPLFRGGKVVATYGLTVLTLITWTTYMAWDARGGSDIGAMMIAILAVLLLGIQALVVGWIVDVLLIALVRSLLKRAAVSSTLKRALALTAISTLVPAAVVLILSNFLPALGIVALPYYDLAADPEVRHFLARFWSLALPAASGIAVITSILFLLTILTAIAVRLLSSILPRAIYAMVTAKVLENRKYAGAMGVMLVSVWFPDAQKWLKNAVAAVLG